MEIEIPEPVLRLALGGFSSVFSLGEEMPTKHIRSIFARGR